LFKLVFMICVILFLIFISPILGGAGTGAGNQSIEPSLESFELPKEADLSPESHEIVQRITYFYLDPDIDWIPKALSRLDGFRWFSHSNHTLIGFFAALFENNSHALDRSFQEFSKLKPESRFLLITSAWIVHQENLKKTLDRFKISWSKEELDLMENLEGEKAPDLFQPNGKDPVILDLLWGGFYAMGTKSYIEGLASLLDHFTEGTPFSIEQKLAQFSFDSLVLNSFTHQRAYDHLLSVSSTCASTKNCMSIWRAAANGSVQRSNFKENDLQSHDFAAKFRLHKRLKTSQKPSSLVTLAADYLFGLGTKRDVPQGLDLLREAVESRSTKGMILQGKVSANPDCGKVDLRKGFQLYERAANLGSPEGKFRMALSFLLGKGTQVDEVKSIDLLAEAADAGYLPAQKFLGQIYLDGEFIEQDYDKGIHWLERASRSGSALAAISLWKAHYARKPSKVNPTQAQHWLTQAAGLGHPRAFTLLYAATKGNQPIWESGSRAAALIGDAEAQFELGMEY